MPCSSASSKSAPTPKVLVITPRARSSPACRWSSAGSVMPWFARPSLSSMTRVSWRSSSRAATCSQPRSHPAPRSVLPRASIFCRRSRAFRLASADAGALSKTTSTISSYTTIENRSVGLSSAIDRSTASFARAIFCPAIEPDRSSTNATLSGGRGPEVRDSGAVKRTSTKRSLPPLARMYWRSVRTSKVTRVLQFFAREVDELEQPAVDVARERSLDVELDAGDDDDALPLGPLGRHGPYPPALGRPRRRL